jgi:hypothetical protein
VKFAFLCAVTATLVFGVGCEKSARATLPAATYQVVDRDGDREQVELVRDTVLAGLEVPAGSRIWFNTAGHLLSLDAGGPITLFGITYPKGSTMSFEHIYSTPAREELVSVRLGGEAMVGPNAFGEGDTLSRFVAGKPTRVVLGAERVFGGERFAAGGEVGFTEGGTVKYSMTPEEREHTKARLAQKRNTCRNVCGMGSERCMQDCMTN